MELQKVNYKGLANCLSLSNNEVELIITTDLGPRILFYGYTGGQNFFCNFDDQIANIIPDTWQSYGGHRLWHAPEVAPRTYYPDNDPVKYEWNESELRLETVVEKDNFLQKVITISLASEGTGVKLKHKLYNRGPWDIKCSAWCLSVMAAGGRAIVPQEEYIPHGEGPGETFLPARSLVVWPFTFMGDPRFNWGTKFIQMRQDNNFDSKQKIGMDNHPGWAAYALNDEVFIKKFDYIEGAEYPDKGCNCELFTMLDFLEMETLSPLVDLGPGSCIEHNESWSLAKVAVPKEDEEIKAAITPLI